MPVPVTTCLQTSLRSSLSIYENMVSHGMSQHNHMQAHEREDRHRRTAEALSKVPSVCSVSQHDGRYNRCIKDLQRRRVSIS